MPFIVPDDFIDKDCSTRTRVLDLDFSAPVVEFEVSTDDLMVRRNLCSGAEELVILMTALTTGLGAAPRASVTCERNGITVETLLMHLPEHGLRHLPLADRFHVPTLTVDTFIVPGLEDLDTLAAEVKQEYETDRWMLENPPPWLGGEPV